MRPTQSLMGLGWLISLEGWRSCGITRYERKRFMESLEPKSLHVVSYNRKMRQSGRQIERQSCRGNGGGRWSRGLCIGFAVLGMVLCAEGQVTFTNLALFNGV